MFTIFTTTKSFKDIALRNQTNAIRSWMHLPDCKEVIVFGEEQDKEVIEQLGATYIGDCACNPSGKTRVDEMFRYAQMLSATTVLAYVNADIVLLPNFATAVEHATAKFDQFMLIGQRWDVDIDQLIVFDQSYVNYLHMYAKTHGKLHSHWGKDYFVFRRPLLLDIPPFSIARCYFDNFLVYASLDNGMAVIDATQAITALHCNHPAPFTHPLTTPEYQYNYQLCDPKKAYTGHTTDATWVMDRQYRIHERN